MRRLVIPLVLVLVVLASILVVALILKPGEKGPTPVIFCTDGGPDDVMTLVYLLNDPAIDLRGVVLSNGEIHPAAAAPLFLSGLEAQGRGDIPVVVGFDRMLDPNGHEFPAPWRQAADALFGVQLPPSQGRLSQEFGWCFIDRVVKENPGTVILITGPEADLALALRSDPSLARRIGRVVVMGGAVGMPGNVHHDWPNETNTVSEWNIWVDPKAADEVFSSGVRLSIVPLNAAGKVFIDRGYLRPMISSGRQGPAAAAQLYAGMLEGFKTDKICVWDLAAGVAVLHPDYFDWARKDVNVVTEAGPTHGQTVAAGGSRRTQYASDVDADALLRHVANVMLGRESEN